MAGSNNNQSASMITFNLNKIKDSGYDVDNILNSLRFFTMLKMRTGLEQSFNRYMLELKEDLGRNYDKSATDFIILKSMERAGNMIPDTFLRDVMTKRGLEK